MENIYVDEKWLKEFKQSLEKLSCEELHELLRILNKKIEEPSIQSYISDSSFFKYSFLTNSYIKYIVGRSKDFCKMSLVSESKGKRKNLI